MMNNLDIKFNKLLIIDGSYLLHRALHVKNLFELKSHSGKRSGGIYQVLKSINYELRINGDYFPVVCWDAGLSKRRTKVYNNYKHALDKNNESVVLTENNLEDDYLTQYRQQRAELMEILDYAGIPSLRFNLWEGDDLMYILSKISKESLVLTDDRDLLQLVSDSCKVRRPMANELFDVERLLQDYNINKVEEFVWHKSIIGDESDNIPGCCKGVGSKTAQNIVKLINLCNDKELSFREHIHDKDKLEILCKENDIKFFKAYLNFDIPQFAVNLELIDLSRVKKDITDDILTSIISTINNCKNTLNYFSLISRLNDYSIHDVNVDELMYNVKLASKNIELRKEGDLC